MSYVVFPTFDVVFGVFGFAPFAGACCINTIII